MSRLELRELDSYLMKFAADKSFFPELFIKNADTFYYFSNIRKLQ